MYSQLYVPVCVRYGGYNYFKVIFLHSVRFIRFCVHGTNENNDSNVLRYFLSVLIRF